MAEDEIPRYSAAERLMALAGLIVAAAVLFILADVLSGGKLTGCAGCEDHGEDKISDQ